jgi:acyl carrier protein
MDSQALLDTTINIIRRILEDKGWPSSEICESTLLLGSSLGIDSLDLATIVVQLTEATGKDPFRQGFIEFRTVGELARIYAA